MTFTPPDDAPPVTSLSKAQRRVLGVLVEKAYTTPEYYPLTLKAATAGCNQKSNRDPVANYTEDDVAETLEQLRGMGLAAEVHTESGRTLRYRHYMRHRFTLSEPQLAVLTELLLRGRQQLGELRTRASRMVPIESLEQLREALQGLLEMDLVQASGPLERRGIEVDHNLYPPQEARRMAPLPESDAGLPAPPPPARAETSVTPVPSAAGHPAPATAALASEPIAALEHAVEELRLENRALREDVEQLKTELRRMTDEIDQLRRDLGG